MSYDYVHCPMCGGPGGSLGSLGSLAWFRCRNCGADFSSREATATGEGDDE
jgi:tRNA(Ile2) C34 agmatinyltransferase TiaS